jgi:hypothetical protein
MTNPKGRDSDFLKQLTSFTATIGLLLLAAVLTQSVPNGTKTKILAQIIAVLGLVTLALTRSGLDLGRKLAEKAQMWYSISTKTQNPSQLSRTHNCNYSY